MRGSCKQRGIGSHCHKCIMEKKGADRTGKEEVAMEGGEGVKVGQLVWRPDG